MKSRLQNDWYSFQMRKSFFILKNKSFEYSKYTFLRSEISLFAFEVKNFVYSYFRLASIKTGKNLIFSNIKYWIGVDNDSFVKIWFNIYIYYNIWIFPELLKPDQHLLMQSSIFRRKFTTSIDSFLHIKNFQLIKDPFWLKNTHI